MQEIFQNERCLIKVCFEIFFWFLQYFHVTADITVDSVRAEEEETLRIHGAATAGTYEIFIDFSGYTEEEARQVMDSIDLSLYEGAE